ncbi:MAG: hypothetical protein AAFR61_17975 [Bacteroidota bacterium]
MNIREIQQKYWAGETSLEEEKALRAWAQSPPFTEEKTPFRTLFGYFDTQKAIHSEQVVQPYKRKKLQNWMWAASLAAALVIPLAIYVSQPAQEDPQLALYEDTFSNPEEAYQETKKALQLVSKKLNKGADHRSQLSKVQKLTAFFPSVLGSKTD